MATLFRADGWVKSVQGQAIAGAQVYICLQPADSSFLPPIPLASIFADPAGALPITQPIFTDGFGHYSYYAASGIPYTEVVVNNGNLQVSYPYQIPMGASLSPFLPPFTGDPTQFLNGLGVFSVPSGGGGGAVSTVFGRAGNVLALGADYSAFYDPLGAAAVAQAASDPLGTAAAAVVGLAPLASPAFTVVPTAPTAVLGTNTTQIATTAFVLANAGSGVTTQNNVTGSRALATPYQNTGTKPMFVSVIASAATLGAGGGAEVNAQTDSSNPPTTYVAITSTTFVPPTNYAVSLFFIVLPGNWYQVSFDTGTGSITFWLECV